MPEICAKGLAFCLKISSCRFDIMLSVKMRNIEKLQVACVAALLALAVQASDEPWFGVPIPGSGEKPYVADCGMSAAKVFCQSCSTSFCVCCTILAAFEQVSCLILLISSRKSLRFGLMRRNEILNLNSVNARSHEGA